LQKYFKEFLDFHDGRLNKALHILGFTLLGLGIIQKSLALVIIGGITQELGHVYQYSRTKRQEDNPWHGIKSQSIFAIPIFILIVIYVLFTR
jgi:uncharacterized membrane protein YGL010W